MQEITYDLCIHVGGGGNWLADFFQELKTKLESKGLKILLFTLSPEIAAIWEQKSNKDYLLLPPLPENVDEKFCLDLIEGLGYESIGTFYRTEKYVFNLTEEFCVKHSCRYIHAVSQLKDSARAKHYLTYEGDEFDHNAFRLLCNLHEGIIHYFGYSNLDLRTHFHTNEKRYWETPREGIPESIPESELQWIDDYIKKYTGAQTKLWGDPKKWDIKFEWDYIPKAFRKMGIQLINPPLDKRFNFTNTISRYFVRLFRRQLAPIYYTKNLQIEEGELYYYFPLHVPDDSQLTQRGLPFFNQAALVETLSMYIPYPYKLIVKEHPNGRGIYQLNQLKRISRLKNVLLVPPQMNSHGIIPKVKAIFAINSSVGYEAIMYKKPVVALGRSFYWQNGVTLDINSLYELENINSRIKQFKLEDKDVIDFIWRVKKNTYDVNMYHFTSSNYQSKVEPYAEAIYKEIFGKRII